MITIGLFSHVDEEIQCIRRAISAYSIRNAWANCRIDVIRDYRDLRQSVNSVDILISDMSDPEVVTHVKKYKAENQSVRIFPIAGAEVPPIMYVCPEIMPCGLFWRPVVQVSAQPVVEQMMALLHAQSVSRSQDSFRITGKQKVQDFPYSEILYFEAREKKIVLRLSHREILFAETLSELEQNLPPEFIRCHKSFIVNRDHILSVDRTTSCILLDSQLEIPLSRSYKKTFWEVYRDDR